MAICCITAYFAYTTNGIWEKNNNNNKASKKKESVLFSFCYLTCGAIVWIMVNHTGAFMSFSRQETHGLQWIPMLKKEMVWIIRAEKQRKLSWKQHTKNTNFQRTEL